jgi:hypothetical protein
LRKNGLTDIVTDSYDNISVVLNQGKGKFEDGTWTAVTGGASCGVSADFNNDGKPDVAVITTTGVSIVLGTGEAKSPFTTGTSIAVPGAVCMVTGDLNGDGIPDLLVAVNGSPNALLSYLGNGEGTFTLKSTTPTPNSGGWVVLADFNNHGKLDFATSGNLLALGNGDGTFQTPAAIVANPPSSGFSGIAAGDINNDGWQDLVLTNSQTNPPLNAFVLVNNQQGGFTLGLHPGTIERWRRGAAADSGGPEWRREPRFGCLRLDQQWCRPLPRQRYRNIYLPDRAGRFGRLRSRARMGRSGGCESRRDPGHPHSGERHGSRIRGGGRRNIRYAHLYRHGPRPHQPSGG